MRTGEIQRERRGTTHIRGNRARTLRGARAPDSTRAEQREVHSRFRIKSIRVRFFSSSLADSRTRTWRILRTFYSTGISRSAQNDVRVYTNCGAALRAQSASHAQPARLWCCDGDCDADSHCVAECVGSSKRTLPDTTETPEDCRGGYSFLSCWTSKLRGTDAAAQHNDITTRVWFLVVISSHRHLSSRGKCKHQQTRYYEYTLQYRYPICDVARRMHRTAYWSSSVVRSRRTRMRLSSDAFRADAAGTPTEAREDAKHRSHLRRRAILGVTLSLFLNILVIMGMHFSRVLTLY